MTREHDQDGPQSSTDDLTLLAFGELPSDQVESAERILSRDSVARAGVQAMRRLARLGSQDSSTPSDDLLAVTRGSVHLSLARRRRRRRIGIVAVVGSVAAAAILVVIAARTSAPTDSGAIVDADQVRSGVDIIDADGVASGVEIDSASATQPVDVRLTDADRQVISETIARMRYERTRDTSWEDQTTRLRRDLSRARFGRYNIATSPRRYSLLRRRIKDLSRDIAPEPQVTQPAGSTQFPANAKEPRHA